MTSFPTRTACQQTTTSPSWFVVIFLRSGFRCTLSTKRELLVDRHPFDKIPAQRHDPSQSDSRFEFPVERRLGVNGSWFQDLISTGYPGLGHCATNPSRFQIGRYSTHKTCHVLRGEFRSPMWTCGNPVVVLPRVRHGWCWDDAP